MDWTITVPLKMIKFNLILKAVRKPVSACMFWRLLLGTIATAEHEWIAVVVVLPLHAGTLGCTQGGLGSACPGLAGTQSGRSTRLGVEW